MISKFPYGLYNFDGEIVSEKVLIKIILLRYVAILKRIAIHEQAKLEEKEKADSV